MLLYTRLAPPKIPKRRSRADLLDDPSLDGVSTAALENQALSRAAQKRMTLEQWESPPWCSDAPFGSSVSVEGLFQQPVSSIKCSEDAADQVFATWASDITEHDGCLDVASLDFAAPESPVKQGGEDSQNAPPIDVATSGSDPKAPSLAVMAPVSIAAPILEVRIPAFAEFSQRPNRRALIDHFANVLSHLIVLREDEGNPFQQLVLPLSQKSPAVLNAVFALTSAHLEHRGVYNSEKSVYFHNQAIRGLAALISRGCGANRNELLAAIILVIYYEVLVQAGRSNIVDGHLKGAMAIMCNSQALNDPTGAFLERAFRFYDVITALSFGSTPILPAPGSGHLALFPPIDCRGATVPMGNADTLLGMATSLWPIIHRLSTLGGLKRELHSAELRGDHAKVAMLQTEFETTASAVELALQEWVLPPDESSPNEAEKNPTEVGVSAGKRHMQSILNSAMAYRHSGLVYLYRAIYGCGRRHAVVQRHTHISLNHCVGTVRNGGPMGALLWPLFVASCEAIDPMDRDLSRQAFTAVGRRQGMTNIERARRIVEEVWKRADNGEDVDEMTHMGEQETDLWRRVSEDMGVAVVFG
ncbi:hypothetical protein Trco_004553 [Trichoderma cornu-damae]|uniref:Uncharacterized protein n=1 Tax=Trichoderma cornu-damae TaxID=654480 RepID=A0A9P8QL04_9HYPO|nr:hypothetical protein Trco_004553 [Trichoderma cornu-damae]